MKHFFAAANYTDNLVLTGDFVLSRGEAKEKSQSNNNQASGYDYEDLVSNLLGVYFEEYLENFKVSDEDMQEYLEKGEVFVLEKFLEEIGVVNDVETAPNYDDLQKDHHTSSNDKNTTYTPKYTTEKRDKKIDKKIKKRLKKFEDGKG